MFLSLDLPTRMAFRYRPVKALLAFLDTIKINEFLFQNLNIDLH